MPDDPYRERLREFLRRADHTMKSASVAIGRNPTYLQQYLARGQPRVLAYRDAESLAELLKCDAEDIRHPRVPPRRKARRARRRPPVGAPVAAVPEMDVAAGAGHVAINEDAPRENARWYLPEAMLRQEGGANPADLRIVRVRGDSMEPLLSEGDRLMVDTARTRPSTGEMCAVWDGHGLVVKRVEIVRGVEPVRLRLSSANPRYASYTCLADEARIVGKVIWAVRRM